MKYSWIAAFILLIACNAQPEPFSGSEELVISDTTRHASCSYFTRNAKGQLVLCWVEETSGSEPRMCYAVSPDDGATFDKTQVIPTAAGIHAHAENMPKLLFRPNGEVLAMYGAQSNDPRNKYAGKVYYTRSEDGGRTWLPANALVADTASYDQRYFDMALLPSGEAAAIWLDNRKDHALEGSTLFMATTGDGYTGFGREKPLVQTVCQCCRTDLYVDAQGALHAAFRDIINDTIRDMVHIISTDGGRSFSQPQRISMDNWAISGCPHTGPTMVKNASGLHFAWFTMGGGEGVFYCQSADNGITYTRRESISAKATARHPQITALPNGHLALVWDEAADSSFNRIGIQYKHGNGEKVAAGYLTPPGEYANFPVVQPAGENKIVVAYKKKTGEKERVCVKQVSL